MGKPETETTELPPKIRALLEARVAEAEAGAAFLLPARLDGTMGLYRESQIAIPKALKAVGVPVEFLHSSGYRRTLGEFSSELVVSFALGVAQNMTWDSAKQIWQYVWAKAQTLSKTDDPATVSIEVTRLTLDGRVIEGLRITGLANDETAVEVVRALTGEPTDQPPL